LATTPQMLGGLILWLLVFVDLVLKSFLDLSSLLQVLLLDDIRSQNSARSQFISLVDFLFTYGLKCRNKCEIASISYFYLPTGLLTGYTFGGFFLPFLLLKTSQTRSKFDAVYASSTRLAIVFILCKLGYIDKSGRYIWQPAK